MLCHLRHFKLTKIINCEPKTNKTITPMVFQIALRSEKGGMGGGGPLESLMGGLIID